MYEDYRIEVFQDRAYCLHCQKINICTARRISKVISDFIICGEFQPVGSIKECENCAYDEGWYNDKPMCRANPKHRETDCGGCRHWQIAPNAKLIMLDGNTRVEYATNRAVDDLFDNNDKTPERFRPQLKYWSRESLGMEIEEMQERMVKAKRRYYELTGRRYVG